MALPIAGLGALRRRWPVVARAFEPAEPLRFRELSALLEATGGSRRLAERCQVDREVLVSMLSGQPAPDAAVRALRALQTSLSEEKGGS